MAATSERSTPAPLIAETPTNGHRDPDSGGYLDILGSDSAAMEDPRERRMFEEDGEQLMEVFDPPRDLTYVQKPRQSLGPQCGKGGRCGLKPGWCGFKWGSEPWHIPPYVPKTYKTDWKQVLREILAGFTVAFAQVPGSLAFASIAGVDPLLGLHPAWIIGVCTSGFGSRPGMINGATGVRAATIAPYVQSEGVEMLFWIVLMISVYQTLFAMLSLPRFVKLLPRSAMVGFSNALAIIIFIGQFSSFHEGGNADNPWRDGTEIGYMMLEVFVTIIVATIFDLWVPISVPPALFGIVAAVIVEHAILRPAGVPTPTIGDVAPVAGGLPVPFWLDDQYSNIPPLNLDTFKIVAWPAFIAAAAGAVEAVMTMEVINDLTDTGNPVPNQQLYALSLGNFISGLFGTMGGGATIGESVINILNGANGYYRISGLMAALTMFLFIMVAAPMIEAIPVASLVGVMFIIVFKVFEWDSLPQVFSAFLPQRIREHRFCRRWAIRKITRVDALTVIIVVVVTMLFDLFTGTAAGTLVTAACYCWETGFQVRARTSKVMDAKGQVKKKIYYIEGPLFFASAMRLPALFTPKEDPDMVEVHFSHQSAVVYDFSGIHSLNIVGQKYKELGKAVVIKHLGKSSFKMIQKADGTVQHFEYFAEADDGLVAQPMAPARPHVAQRAFELRQRTLRRSHVSEV